MLLRDFNKFFCIKYRCFEFNRTKQFTIGKIYVKNVEIMYKKIYNYKETHFLFDSQFIVVVYYHFT